MFLRDIVCQHPSLQAALQKWCDCNLIFTWYQMSTSHVIHFIRDILSETQSWIDQLLSDTVPAFLEIRWAQMLSRALGVTTQQTDMVLASTLLSADTRLPLAKLHHLYPSIVLPCYSPANESWSMNWGEARRCMRRLLSRTHQGYAFMMIPDSLPTKRHFALARLLRLQITKLGSSFPVPVMSKGPGGSCTLWVAHTAPLERRWLSSVFFTTRSLCNLTGAVMDPQLFSPLFAHPSVDPQTQPAACNRTTTFSDIWDAEVEKRRTALAPRWNARTRKLVTTKAWPTVFRSWDGINKHLHECPSAHARKIHALRLGDFFVITEGCWVYVLWCLHDHRV